MVKPETLGSALFLFTWLSISLPLSVGDSPDQKGELLSLPDAVFRISHGGSGFDVVTPAGRPIWLLGVNHIGSTDRAAGGMSAAAANLRDWNFNCAGGDNSGAIQHELPYFVTVPLTATAHWLPGPRFEFEDVFDPTWSQTVTARIAATCRKHRANPNLVGYFWTDTPRWNLDISRTHRGTDWVSFLRSLPSGAAGRMAYVRFLKRYFGDSIDRFNTAFRFSARSFDDLLLQSFAGVELQRPEVRACDEAFLTEVAAHIYSTAAAAFQQHDPDRLLFGEKYKAHDHTDAVLQTAGRFVDVISIQPGPEVGPRPGPGRHERQFDHAYFKQVADTSGKPILICDHAVSWYSDQHPVTLWHQFEDQQSAAACYQQYVLQAAATPYIVGYCRCQYRSRYQADRGLLKQGLLNEHGEAQQPFVKLVSAANHRAQKLRTSSQGSTDEVIPPQEVNAKQVQSGTGWKAIRHATLIDGNGGPPVSDATILIRDHQIVAVGTDDEIAVPPATDEFDATGLFVLPGLIDSHFHARDNPAPLVNFELRNGVTTLRDPGHPFKYYTKILQADSALPRIFLCGGHLDGEPAAWPDQAVVVQTKDDAANAVQRHVGAGASAIKIYFRVPQPLIESACERADQLKVPVTAHLELVDADDAIRAGVDGIEHITSFGTALAEPDHAGQFREVVRQDGKARKEWRYKLWSRIDPDGPRARQLIDLIVQEQVVVSPTLAVFEVQAENDQPDERVTAFGNMLQFFGNCAKAGARVVVGSHTNAPYAARGKAYLRELQLMAESGMSPMRVIVAATRTNAEFFNASARLGTVEACKLADLVLVGSNPLQNVSNLDDVRKVMLNGYWVSFDD